VKLFVGLEIPSRVRAAVEERTEPLRRSLPAASWVSCANYHLFLGYLGETDEAHRSTVGAALSVAFASQESFEIQLVCAGSFPPDRPARVLWVGVKNGEVLERLQRSVWRSLTQVVDIEAHWRPFHPHLTVARCPRAWTRRCAAVWCRACAGKVGDPFEVRQGALFSSDPGRDSSSYQVIETYPMKASQ